MLNTDILDETFVFKRRFRHVSVVITEPIRKITKIHGENSTWKTAAASDSDIDDPEAEVSTPGLGNIRPKGKTQPSSIYPLTPRIILRNMFTSISELKTC